MMRWISITAIGSMPAKGSSSRMKRGCVASARAISTRRRSPPDSAGAGESRSFSMPRSCSRPLELRARCAALLQRAGRRRRTAARAPRGCSPRRQLAEDRRFLRQVATGPGASAGGSAGRCTGWPSMLICAGVGAHQADDHVEGGGLAGAVGPEQADHLAGADGQVHVLDHHARAVALLQAAASRRLVPGGRGAASLARHAALNAAPRAGCERLQRRREARRRGGAGAAGCRSRGASTARTRPLGLPGVAAPPCTLNSSLVLSQMISAAVDLVGHHAAAQAPHRGVADEAQRVGLAVVFDALGLALDGLVDAVALLPEAGRLARRCRWPWRRGSRRASRATRRGRRACTIVPWVMTTLPLKTTDLALQVDRAGAGRLPRQRLVAVGLLGRGPAAPGQRSGQRSDAPGSGHGGGCGASG